MVLVNGEYEKWNYFSDLSGSESVILLFTRDCTGRREASFRSIGSNARLKGSVLKIKKNKRPIDLQAVTKEWIQLLRR